MAEPGGPEGPWPPTFFLGGALRGPNLRVYFYNIASACTYLKLNRFTIEIETQERA